MGRRSRKRYKRPVRTVRRLPTIFQCPACGLPTLTIDIKEEKSEEGSVRIGYVKCLNPKCGLRSRLINIPKIYENVDVYAKFLDLYTEGKVEVHFVKGGAEVEEFS